MYAYLNHVSKWPSEYTHICVYIYVHVYVCMCVFVYPSTFRPQTVFITLLQMLNGNQCVEVRWVFLETVDKTLLTSLGSL